MNIKKIHFDEAHIIYMYNSGVSLGEMAKQYGCTHQTVSTYCRSLVDQGKLIARDSHIRATGEARVERKQIFLDLYHSNFTLDEICDKMQISFYTAKMYEKELQAENKLTIKSRKRPTKFLGINQHIEVPSTLEKGECIKCNPSVSRTCVYGTDKGTKYLCNYALIAGHSRSLGDDGCDYTACTKYSKISRSNPRFEIKEF